VNDLAGALDHVVAAAAEHKAGVALVGGFAVSVRTEPRFTRDLDLAVSVRSDRDAEAMIRTLTSRGFAAVAVVEQEAAGRLGSVRMHGPSETVVDLLFASSGIEAEIVAAADPIEIFPGTVVPVATVGHLLAMKVLSVADDRPLDAADLGALRSVATTDDLESARRAVALITERGFARGRDLDAALDALPGRADADGTNGYT
jgi:hypothetical protein